MGWGEKSGCTCILYLRCYSEKNLPPLLLFGLLVFLTHQIFFNGSREKKFEAAPPQARSKGQRVKGAI